MAQVSCRQGGQDLEEGKVDEELLRFLHRLGVEKAQEQVKIKPHIVGTKPKFEHSFPEGFVLVIDTREQDQLFKRPPKGLVCVRDGLRAGDYSIRGFENCLSVERKSLPDFLSSIGTNRERFKRELGILQGYEHKWIFLEATHEECLTFNEHSSMHPNAVRQTIASIEIRYGIPFYFQKDRHFMERHLLDLFIKYYRVKRGE